MHGKGEIMGRFVNKIKNKQYGQAMVEFALTLPIFLLLVFGVIELSRFFLVYSSVYTASREASRLGSAVGVGGLPNYMNCEAIRQTATRMGNFGGVQDDDINIFYEKSATAPSNERVECDGEYVPELGDRLVVEIETQFDSLLGIVPDLPVRVENGRTIMSGIIIERTPKPYELCSANVEYVKPTTIKVHETDPKILFIEIENDAEYTSYTITRIEDISWDQLDGIPKLLAVKWAGQIEPIWTAESVAPEVIYGRDPDFTIPTETTIQFWIDFPRNLGPNETQRLEFVFNDDVSTSIDLSFKVVMQHSNLTFDFCNPVQ